MPNNPTVKKITEEWLKEHGYSGLFSDYCGCELDDLMPCGGWNEGLDRCKAGYVHHCEGDCPECYRSEYCEMDYEFSNMYVCGEK